MNNSTFTSWHYSLQSKKKKFTSWHYSLETLFALYLLALFSVVLATKDSNYDTSARMYATHMYTLYISICIYVYENFQNFQYLCSHVRARPVCVGAAYTTAIHSAAVLDKHILQSFNVYPTWGQISRFSLPLLTRARMRGCNENLSLHTHTHTHTHTNTHTHTHTHTHTNTHTSLWQWACVFCESE